MTQKSSKATSNYLAMLEQCPLPTLYLSPVFRVEHVNDAAEELSKGTWVGKLLTDLCAGVSSGDLQQALSSSQGLTAKRIRLKVGDSFTPADLVIFIWPITGDSETGLIVQFWPEMVDITARHDVDARIQDLGDQLRGVVEENRVEQKALRTTISQQTALAALSQEAQKEGDIQSLCQLAAELIAQPIDAQMVLFLQKKSTGAAQLLGCTGSLSASHARLAAGLVDNGFPSLATRSGHIIGDLERCQAKLPADLKEQNFRSAILLRVEVPDSPPAVLLVFFIGPYQLQEEDRLFLQAMCNVLAVAMERKLIGAKLQLLSDELRRSNLDLQQFASAAAHDLQEPLRSVVSYLDLLQQHVGDSLDEKSTKYIGVASAAGKRMQALISDLLQYSRLNTREAAMESVDCNGIVEYAIHDLRSSIEETNATIEVGKLPVIFADPGRLVQVFQNLISNAIKFRSAAPPHITINAAHQEKFWLFSVRDNGIGFEMEYAERIFVIFQRLHARTKYPGTGIGLAMCKKIIERHGGKIWVESKPDEGSTFFFTLPDTVVTTVDGLQSG